MPASSSGAARPCSGDKVAVSGGSPCGSANISVYSDSNSSSLGSTEDSNQYKYNMEFFPVAIVLILAILTTWFQYSLRRRRSARLPPGPYPLPIIGNILQLGASPHESLARLSKTYGPLMSLRLGQIYTVVVSSPETAKEILQKNDQAFSRRNVTAAARSQGHHEASMVFLPVGKEWRKWRKISKEQMFSHHRMEASQGLRQAKLQKLVEYLQRCCDGGRVVDIAEATFITTLNLMSATLFSLEVADFDSDVVQEFKNTFDGLKSIIAVPNLGDFFPLLEPLDLQGIRKKSELYFAKMLGLIDDIISERLQSRANKTDLLQTLLDLSAGSSEHELSTDFIKHMLLDLFFAGSDTTASMTEWAMAELLLNPEKLRKAKHELSSVIGQDNQVQESDMSRLPYLQAVIKEVLRCHPTAPLLVPRKSDFDVEVGGYVIPKDTQIFVNVWAFSKDANLWSNPEVFEPERFLGRKIDYRGQDFELIPFGSGRRICPGLPLADRMFPMLVATLIHNFDWELEPGAAKPIDMTAKFGIVLRKEVPLKAIPIKP